MEIEIRDAVTSDARALCEAEQDVALTPGRLVSRPHELVEYSFVAQIQKLNAIRGKYLVARKGDQIVGHGFLEPLHLEAIKHVCNLTMVVHEGHQGQGIGKLLLNHLIDWAKESEHIEKIELHVRSTNERAIRLYESCGFQKEGCWKKRIKLGPGNYLDDVLMGLWVK